MPINPSNPIEQGDSNAHYRSNDRLILESDYPLIPALINTLIMLTIHPIRSGNRINNANFSRLFLFHFMMVFLSVAIRVAMNIDVVHNINWAAVIFKLPFLYTSFFIGLYLGVCICSLKVQPLGDVYRILAYSSYYSIYINGTLISAVPILACVIFCVTNIKNQFSLSTITGVLIMNLAAGFSMFVLFNL